MPHRERNRLTDVSQEFNADTAIQISNARVKSDPEGISRLRERFRELSCICIPQLLDPTLLATLQNRLEHCQWKSNAHNDPGGELGLDDITEDPQALHLLYFSANRPEFRTLLEEVTGCQPLNAFGGRLYRKLSGRGHYNEWHDDAVDNRLVGMSINLSPRPYRGGLFQLRRRDSGAILAEVANTGCGAALIFRISEELEHRVTDVEGDEPKTAFAGWFRHDRPGFFEGIQKNKAPV
jgi:hypothetical protein